MKKVLAVTGGSRSIGAATAILAAAKGAIDTLTIGLAREVATEGVTVNPVRAGAICTDIHASGGEPNRVKSSVPAFTAHQPLAAPAP